MVANRTSVSGRILFCKQTSSHLSGETPCHTPYQTADAPRNTDQLPLINAVSKTCRGGERRSCTNGAMQPGPYPILNRNGGPENEAHSHAR